MKNPTNIRSATLVAALAAVTATAFAMTSEEDIYATTPPIVGDGVVVAEDTTVRYLDSNEVIIEEPAPLASQDVVAVVERPAAQPPVTVEERRLTRDERIQGEVMDAIYNMPNINGKIGVESNNAVVTLSGYTTTAGQAWRAARTAGSIQGVRYVQNDIRPRLGGSI
jgi:hyperosmotically inducible periplasmic protein